MLALLAVAWEPQFSWIEREKVRAAYFYAGQKFEHVDDLARHGFNSFLLKTGLSVEDPDGDRKNLDRIRGFGRRAEKFGLKFFPVLNFASSGEVAALKGGRRFTDRNGRRHGRTPCPLDEGYWRTVILRRFLALARRADELGISGLIFDPEMYGADIGIYPADGCWCDFCFSEFLKAKGLEASVPPEGRFKWAMSKGLLDDYLAWQRERVAEIARRIREEVHKVNPRLILGFLHYVPGHFFFDGLVRGLGAPGRPVTVWSELTYSSGYTEYVDRQTREFEREGAHVVFVPGIWISRHHPKAVPAHCYYMALKAHGYWVFTTYSLAKRPEELRGDYAIPRPAAEYWRAFEEANRAIARKMKEPSFEPGYKVVRIPLVPFVKEMRVEVGPLKPLLPSEKPARKTWPPTLLRGQVAVLTLLHEGEGCTVKVQNRRLGPYVDATAVLVLDPEGREVVKGECGLDKSAELRFVARKSGLYTIIVNSGANRCAVEVVDKPEVYFAPTGLNICGRAAPLYFFVPKGTRKFELSVSTGGSGEFCDFALYDPEGREVASRKNFAGSERLEVPVPQGCDGKVWRIVVEEAEGKVFEDVTIRLRGAPALFSEHPTKLLVPASG